MNCATNKSLERKSASSDGAPDGNKMELVFSVIGMIVLGVLVLGSGFDPAACYCGGRNGKRGPKGGMIGPARLGLAATAGLLPTD
jgi:hypothetical protein